MILVSIIVYNVITIPIENKIMDSSLENLKSNKYLNKNEESIKTIHNFLKLYGLTQIVITLSNLYYSIRDDIKK